MSDKPNPYVHFEEFETTKRLNESIHESCNRFRRSVDGIKGLSGQQLEYFLIAMARQAQQHEDFKNYPMPKVTIIDFISDLFERGKP